VNGLVVNSLILFGSQILCVITGPVSLVIVNQVDAHFAFVAFTIIFCCFLSMALIFTPKIVELVRKRGNHLSFGGSYMNGTFHDNGSSHEQEERLKKLTNENEELQVSIIFLPNTLQFVNLIVIDY